MSLSSEFKIKKIPRYPIIKCIGVGLAFFILTSILTPLPLLPQADSQEEETPILAVTPAPSTLPADGDEYPIVVVQIQNSTGFPIPAPADTNIILSSSKREVGEVDRTITIPKGETYAVAKFRSTTTPGTTTITAAALGFTVGMSNVVTIDPSSSPIKLVVELGPKQLLPELDGKGMVAVQLQDENGKLTRALDDISISLSSSHPSIAKVDPSILIEAGQSYGRAFFYTTLTPGNTTITASAPGYATGSESLTVIGTTPSQLAVYAAPPEIPERAEANTTIVVQLQDSSGIPVRAPTDVQIAVTTSNTTVGFIDQPSITIETGETYAVTHFIGRLAGNAQITASAQKYTAGFSNVTVVRPGLADEGNLAIYLAPPVVLPDDRPHRAVYLQLKDSIGRTVRASRDINVHLSSSKTEIGSVEQDVVIPAGTTYVATTFFSTHAAGSTTITASATDFITASAAMNVAGSVPDKITVDVVPEQLPSDGEPHVSLILQLQDVDNEPVNAPSDILVTLSSSNTEVGMVEGTVMIPEGTSTATATFYSTRAAGPTTIIVSTLDYASDSVGVVTVEPAPLKLVVTTAPSIIPADGGTYQAIAIQLQDPNGIPARARSDIPISISSSNVAVGEAESNVVLKEGETFVKTVFRTSSRPGTTTISVLSSGFVGSSSRLTSILYPLDLTIAPKEVTIYVSDKANLTLSVKSSGVPVPDATVSWRATVGSILEEAKKTDANGTATARFTYDEAGFLNITATISKIGYQTISRTVNVTVLPRLLSVTISAAESSIETSKPTELNVTVLSGGQPVQNATLSWDVTMGILTRVAEKTDADGRGSAVFFSNENGTAEVNVTASKKGYVAASASVTIGVQAPLGMETTTVIETTETATTEEGGFTILGFDLFMVLGVLGVIIAVVVVIVVLMMRRLRRRGGKELEEGELGEVLEGEE